MEQNEEVTENVDNSYTFYVTSQGGTNQGEGEEEEKKEEDGSLAYRPSLSRK
jgi:hypothetical protein